MRDFKGVWIPKDIYLNKDLTLTEKILYVEIQSLDNENGCFAGNEYFAEFLGVGVTTISKGIKKLIKLGYVKLHSFDGRKRVLTTDSQLVTDEKADLQNVKGRPTKSKSYIIQDNNTDNKTTNNYYTDFVSRYNDFCKKQIGVGCKLDGMQGKALKRIIRYLEKESKGERVVEAWEYVLTNWHKLEPFYQKQIKVTQIDSNFINILNQLRNGKGKRTNVSNASQSIRDRAGI